jgi:hypothetical protein
MRFSKAALVIVALLSFLIPANAVTFNWSYTGPGDNNGGGTLEATFVSGVEYQITSVSGVANGFTIIELLTGASTYAGTGTQLFYPAAFQLNVLGFSFSVDTPSGTRAFAIYEDATILSGTSPPDPYNCGGAPFCLMGLGLPGGGIPPEDPIVGLTSFIATPAEVPIPGALPLFVTGFAALALLARSRRKRAA